MTWLNATYNTLTSNITVTTQVERKGMEKYSVKELMESNISKMSELVTPDLIPPQRHWCNDNILSKKPLWKCLKPVKTCSIQASAKPRTVTLKWVKIANSFYLILTILAPPPNWHSSCSGGKPNLHLLSWEGRRGVKYTSYIPAFQVTSQEVSFCLTWIRVLMEPGCLWIAENKIELICCWSAKKKKKIIVLK